MRTVNGKLKLAANERRLGNFVIKLEENHVKLSDINSLFTHRVARGIPVGQFLEMAYKDIRKDEAKAKGVGNWIAVMFTVFSVIPDVEFLEAVFEASRACMERHPEAYGAPVGDVSDEEDAKIIQEVKEMKEFEEDFKKLPGDGD